MTPPAPRNYTMVILAATMAVVIIAAAVLSVIILTSPTTDQSTTTATPPTPTATLQTTATLSSNGLRLSLSAPSSITQGDAIAIDVSLHNTLASRNNLTVPANGTEFSMGPCSQLPLGVAIIRGTYTTDNLSAGKGLDLDLPGMYMCPAEFYIAYWSFTPSSDNISLVSQQPTGSGNATTATVMWTQPAGGNLTYWGYWTGEASIGLPSTNVAFTSFPPGEYTLAAGDAWGQVEVLHFQVMAAPSPLDCSTIASDPSFLRQAGATVGSGPLKLAAYYQQVGSNDTFVLALSASGSSSATLSYLYYGSGGGMQFEPDPSQVQSWQYFAPNGTLVYPATFYPNQCSLLRIMLPQNSTQIPLSFEFSDEQTQTINLSP